jgi:hypothetical protein
VPVLLAAGVGSGVGSFPLLFYGKTRWVRGMDICLLASEFVLLSNRNYWFSLFNALTVLGVFVGSEIDTYVFIVQSISFHNSFN